ncbi:MAG: Dabb family protein [Flavobacteriaceae bacterium]|jgi:phenylalanyl-tRNA synthetase alpha subunit|nr:Dabb family protein [Flavobacteriaceae bacterium]
MIHHIVLWKLKETNKEENAKQIKEKLEALKGRIKELDSIYVGFNMDEAPESNFDVVLNTQFKTFDDLNIYQNHPEHVEVVQFIKSVVEQRVAIDYER